MMSGLLPHSISMNAIVVAVVSCPAPKNVTKSSKAASRSNSGSFAENAFNFIVNRLGVTCGRVEDTTIKIYNNPRTKQPIFYL